MDEPAKNKIWVFLGLGNVLFNEDPAYAHIYLMMYNILKTKNESLTFDKLLLERDELIKKGHILPLKTLMQETLSEEESSSMRQEFRSLLEENWLRYNPLNPDVKDIIKKLSKNFNLGVIANAPAFVRAILQDLDLLSYFKVVKISEDAGLPKPNKGIFLQAMEDADQYAQAGNENFIRENCVMVGDSLEQDIVPGKDMGMTTVQLRWDLNIKYKDSGLLNDRVFSQYYEHLQSYSSRRRQPQNDNETPDFVVSSLKELETLLNSQELKKAVLSSTRSL